MGLKILQICAAPDNWVALFEDDDHREVQIPVCAFALIEEKSGHRFISSISEDQGEGLGMPDCEADNWRGYRKLNGNEVRVSLRGSALKAPEAVR